MSEWIKCPTTQDATPLYARKVAWGVAISFTTDDGDPKDGTLGDLDVPELEWLLRLAQDGEA